MKKLILCLIVFIASLSIGVTIYLYLKRMEPVVFRYGLDDSIRPKNHCLMNPFRDTAPEDIAVSYLVKMRDGNVAIIEPFIDKEHKYILEREKEYPIKSWRIGERKDKDGETVIMFWVKRGGSYPTEESVWFWLNRSNGTWTVKTYNAIY